MQAGIIDSHARTYACLCAHACFQVSWHFVRDMIIPIGDVKLHCVTNAVWKYTVFAICSAMGRLTSGADLFVLSLDIIKKIRSRVWNDMLWCHRHLQGCQFREHAPDERLAADAAVMEMYLKFRDIIGMRPPQLMFPERLTRLVARGT